MARDRRRLAPARQKHRPRRRDGTTEAKIVHQRVPTSAGRGRRSRRPLLPRTSISPALPSMSSSCIRATSIARRPSRTIKVKMAKSRRPTRRCRSQESNKAVTTDASSALGSPSKRALAI